MPFHSPVRFVGAIHSLVRFFGAVCRCHLSVPMSVPFVGAVFRCRSFIGAVCRCGLSVPFLGAICQSHLSVPYIPRCGLSVRFVGAVSTRPSTSRRRHTRCSPCRPPRPPCPGSPRPLESAPSAALQRSLSNEAGLIAPRRRRMGRTLNHQPGPTFLKPLNVAARVSLSSYCRPRKGARIFFADACNSPILDCVSTPYLITVSTTTTLVV